MRRSAALFLLLIFTLETTGCYSWHAKGAPALALKDAKPKDTYRVTMASGEVFELREASVRNDSIIGTADGTRTVRGEVEKVPVRIALPLAKMTKVEQRSLNGVKTVLASAAATATVIGLIEMLTASAPTTPPSTGNGSYNPGTSFCTGGNCTLSCPLIYSWDGSDWRLDSGTFGGAITPALARTDLDNLRFARPDLGLLQFRMTDEAPETEHVDAFTVVAIDHPDGTDVAPDARANSIWHVIANLRAPIAARDFAGRSVLSIVNAPDARTWQSDPTGRNPANPAHLRDGVELTFARQAGDTLLLVVDAQNTEWAAALMGEMVSAFGRLTAPWYDTTTSAAASVSMSRAQHSEGFLQVSVWDGTRWRPSGEIWEAGPEVAKRQVLPINVAGFAGDSLRVRLEAAPSFWRIDYVGLGPVTHAIAVARDLRTVSVTAPRDPNAFAHLASRDHKYLDMERGDTVSIVVYDTASAPAKGMQRSYLARTSGWYRVHGRDGAAPDVAVLAALADGPHGGAKLAVIRMNEALAAARVEVPRVPKQ